MNCPKCGGVKIVVTHEEHTPMSPMAAILVVPIVALYAVVWAYGSVKSIEIGTWPLALVLAPLGIFMAYYALRLAFAMRHHRVREWYQCESCGFEWKQQDETDSTHGVVMR